MTDLFRRTLHGGAIAWRAWTGATLNEARARELPLLVVCGEACDHWSAVLAAELAADAEVAALIDASFIPVAAERLSDPALAQRCQEVLALCADAAGFPCVAIASDAGVFVGAVPWLPLRDRERRPGLARVLLGFAEAWQNDAEALRSAGASLEQRLRASVAPPAALKPALQLDALEAALIAIADPIEGGFGPAPRSLGSEALRFLALRLQHSDHLVLQRTVERSALAWLQGAVCDQLGGGVHRGCVDAAWRQPFCEQRLIDQANAARAWLIAAQALDHQSLRVAAARCLRWTIDHLRRDDGTYAAGRHADAVGHEGTPQEGAHLTWRIADIEAIVGSEAADLIAERFDLAGAPLLAEGHPLAVRQPLDPDEAPRLAGILQRLAVARSERPQPLRDERRDLRGEGLLLAAFALLRETDPSLNGEAEALAHALAHDLSEPQSAGDAAAVALGLCAWGGNDAAAERWFRSEDRFRRPDGRLSCGSDVHLDPPVTSGADDDRGAAAVACLAEAAIALGRRDEARAILHTHAGLLRFPAAAGLGCALALAQHNGYLD